MEGEKGWNLIPSVTVKTFCYVFKPMQISVCLSVGCLAKAVKYILLRICIAVVFFFL